MMRWFILDDTQAAGRWFPDQDRIPSYIFSVLILLVSLEMWCLLAAALEGKLRPGQHGLHPASLNHSWAQRHAQLIIMEARIQQQAIVSTHL